jgi:hypothetical protein
MIRGGSFRISLPVYLLDSFDADRSVSVQWGGGDLGAACVLHTKLPGYNKLLQLVPLLNPLNPSRIVTPLSILMLSCSPAFYKVRAANPMGGLGSLFRG